MSADDPTNATIIHRQVLRDGLWMLRIEPDEGPPPPFIPGQFVTLGLPKPEPDDPVIAARRRRRGGPRLLRRAYSIASRADENRWLEFLLVRIDDGKLTPRLWPLDVGDRLHMGDEAQGDFTLDEVPEDRHLVLAATGTGIAPYVSMVRTYRGMDRWRHVVLIHGARTQVELAYHDELQAIAAEDDGVTYLPALSRESADSSHTGCRGRIQSLLEPDSFAKVTGAALDPQQCDILLCGRPDMIAETTEQLTTFGFTPDTRDVRGNVHSERYW